MTGRPRELPGCESLGGHLHRELGFEEMKLKGGTRASFREDLASSIDNSEVKPTASSLSRACAGAACSGWALRGTQEGQGVMTGFSPRTWDNWELANLSKSPLEG